MNRCLLLDELSEGDGELLANGVHVDDDVPEPLEYTYLDQVRTSCFRKLVDRAVHVALKKFTATRTQTGDEDKPAFSEFFIEI